MHDRTPFPLRAVRSIVALVLAGAALALPYRARASFLQSVAWCAHAPFVVFGALARTLLRALSERGAAS